VDPIPFKTCNYNCVYCQLGRTTPLTNQRGDYLPPEKILAEVREALASPRPIDTITFVGQGEPLLCVSLGWLIRQVKALTDIPVALITNGSLLFKPGVRKEVCAADVVLPSLDAADQETFRRINRPWPRLHIAKIVQGMIAFREEFTGQLWVEVMLVRGLNDNAMALQSIRDSLAQIRPDQVHLNVPIRPPAETWVEPPDDAGLMRAMTILGEAALIITPAEGTFTLSEEMPLTDAIVEIIRRHPMREATLVEILNGAAKQPGQAQATLTALAASRQVQRHVYQGEAFWRYTSRDHHAASHNEQEGP
jgi:wyosine [tRNA(Phe)-imidazoG37] synthetase (radical SAM superfamily)